MKPTQTRVGAPEGPPICRETQSLGQQMLNTPVGIKGLTRHMFQIISNKTKWQENISQFFCPSRWNVAILSAI